MCGERIEALCAGAAASAEASAARTVLLDWLGALTEYAASARGMAEAPAQDRLVDPEHAHVCSVKPGGAVEPLVRHAAQEPPPASSR